MREWPNEWFEGVPPSDVVLFHETQHPRPDGIKLGEISVSRESKMYGEYVKTDDWSYGEWICYHYKSRLQPYISMVRLKVVKGEVLLAVGFTGWCLLAECRWANECRYYPVGQNGLPDDY